jgi:hypothetical protein
VGLQQVVEGDQGPQVVTTGTQEVAPEGGTQEVKVIDRDSKKEFTALLQPIIDIFDNVKESTFSSLKGVTFNQLVNNWNEYKNIDNEDVRTIKYFVENPPNTAIVLDENGVVSDGNHRLIADLINNKESIYAVSQKDNPTALGDLYLEIQQPTIEEVSLKTQAPKLVRDISVLITPATVREATPVTKRIKKLSLNYDKFVKQYAKKKDPKVLAKIKEAENQILNDAKQDIIDEVAKVDGVAVKFSDPKRGLWNGSFEPSFNMILSISPQANTEAVSKLLFDFAEKYSQDAFILETDSEYESDVFSGKRDIPLTEFDENNLMHYPQIIYTFDEPITDEQVTDLSVELEKNGVEAFNINNNEIKVSVIKFFEDTDQQNLTEDEQYEERTRDLDSKSIAAEKATADVLGPDVKVKPTVRIKKSSYQGAKNEGTSDPTRQFDRSDVLKSFKESTTKVEALAVELADLRQKEIDLQ